MELSDFHAIINNFTLGLVNVGIIFDLIGTISKSSGMKQFGWSAIRIGFGFCLLSIITGFISSNSSLIPQEAQSFASYHKLLGFLSAGLLFLGIGIRVSAKTTFEDVAKGASWRGAYLALMTLSLAITVIAGVFGTQLVRHFGVGVQPMEEIREALPNQSPSEPLLHSH